MLGGYRMNYFKFMYFFSDTCINQLIFHYEITFINIVQLLDLYYRDAGSNILRYMHKILLPWDTRSVCLERSWVKYSRGLLLTLRKFSVQRYFAENFPEPLPKTDPLLPILCHCVSTSLTGLPEHWTGQGSHLPWVSMHV